MSSKIKVEPQVSIKESKANAYFKKRQLQKGKGAEMPAGAAMPKMPDKPVPPSPPGADKAPSAEKQAKASATGKQLTPAPPKPKGPKFTAKKELSKKLFKKVEVPILPYHLATKCEFCQKPQFKNGQFDPCLCFAVEKHAKEPFVKLAKTEKGLKLVFRPNAEPEMIKAFLDTLKWRVYQLFSKKNA